MKIGEKVKVTDTKFSYSTYSRWIEDNAPEYRDIYAKWYHMATGSIGKIVKIAKHESEDRELYLVDGGAHVILISEEGIESVSEKYYSTWEILRELETNPKMKFIESSGLIVGLDNWGFLTSDSGELQLSIGGQWEEYNEQVSFGEAFLALLEDNRDIYCLYGGDRHIFFANPLINNVFNEDWIASGEWYIKY